MKFILIIQPSLDPPKVSYIAVLLFADEFQANRRTSTSISSTSSTSTSSTSTSTSSAWWTSRSKSTSAGQWSCGHRSDGGSPMEGTSGHVNCGYRPDGNIHTAKTCKACTKGHGADWCNGDCEWCNGQCILKEDPSIGRITQGHYPS